MACPHPSFAKPSVVCTSLFIGSRWQESHIQGHHPRPSMHGHWVEEGASGAWPGLLWAPLLSSQYIFTDAYAQYLWTTFDFCNTIQGFSIPFRAADLLLHSKASNLLLGFDRSHPNKQVRELRERGQVVLPEVSVLPGGFACPLGDLCSYHFTSHGYRKIYLPGALGLHPGQGVTPLRGPISYTSGPSHCSGASLRPGGRLGLWNWIRELGREGWWQFCWDLLLNFCSTFPILGLQHTAHAYHLVDVV